LPVTSLGTSVSHASGARKRSCKLASSIIQGLMSRDGTLGNWLVRAAGPDPRAGFFTEYLGDAHATDAAWDGGWLPYRRRRGGGIRTEINSLLIEEECDTPQRRKHRGSRGGKRIAATPIGA